MYVAILVSRVVSRMDFHIAWKQHAVAVIIIVLASADKPVQWL